ncbi:MAG: DUF1822 family protein [Cyanobacteria bacterium P01_D01_bin.73]
MTLMDLDSNETLPIAIPITSGMREAADALAAGAPNGAIAGQVRENALATLVGAAYFQLQHYTIDWKRAAVRSPLRFVEDVADIDLRGIGAVECRAIAPGLTRADSVALPLEAMVDRVGCLAIAWESAVADSSSARLLGFWPGFVLAQAQGDSLPLQRLVSLDAMVDYLFAVETLERLLAAEEIPERQRSAMAQTFAQADWELSNKRRRSFQVARELSDVEQGQAQPLLVKEAVDGDGSSLRQFAQRIFEAFDQEMGAL